MTQPLGITGMTRKLLTAAAALVPALAVAQQPTNPTDSGSVALDRIVAIVGDQPITQYDLQERIIALQQQGQLRSPQNEAEFQRMAHDVLGQLIDEEVLVQKATEIKVEVTDADLNTAVERQVRQIRGRFASDAEFRAELQKAGLGSPEEYRRFLVEQMRRGELQRRAIEQLRAEGKIPPVNVTEAEVEAAFNQSRATLPRRPATVTFRQVVVAPRASEAARVIARAKAESLLAEIRGGAEFERVARRESADSISREQGGDLGWARRGQMVAEFERWMFGLRPGDLSPVVETVHGYHIIRVDRVQPGEVKSRHILVRPRIDSSDVARARAQTDTVVSLWSSGVSFDSVARRFHDYASGEETSLLSPMPRDSMPDTYRQAFTGKQANDIVTFEIPGVAGNPKFVVAQLATVDEGGEYKLADLRERVRQQLVEEGAIRRFLDSLRKDIYVAIKLDEAFAQSARP